MNYRIYNVVDRMNITSCIIKYIHNFTLCISIFILVVVIRFIFLLKNYKIVNFLNNINAEFIWTILPIILLLSIRIPSFTLLYNLEVKHKYDLTYKAIRHQWYWSYESNDFLSWSIDSYIDKTNKINRLLEVDNTLILPYNSYIQIIVSSEDVLHSWALPNLGTKIDAVPGRLNSINLFSLNPRKFFGQCSEICRINHSFIPISVEFGSWEDFCKNLY